MAALGWIVFIVVCSYIFWRWLQSLVGLSRALDPGLPVFESERFALRTFLTTIEDTTRVNTDGSNRQELLQFCHTGDHLRLRVFSQGTSDQAEVEVMRWDGAPVGRLEARAAQEVSNSLARGFRVEAVVADIHRSTRLYDTRDVVLKVTREAAA